MITDYRSIHIVRRWIPDGRLAHLTVRPDGLLLYRYHTRHIKLRAAREWQHLGHYLAASGVLALDPDRVGDAPDFEVYLERVPIACLDTFLQVRSGFDRPRHAFLEVQTPAEVVSPELVREMNEDILPRATRLLRPRLV